MQPNEPQPQRIPTDTLISQLATVSMSSPSPPLASYNNLIRPNHNSMPVPSCALNPPFHLAQNQQQLYPTHVRFVYPNNSSSVNATLPQPNMPSYNGQPILTNHAYPLPLQLISTQQNVNFNSQQLNERPSFQNAPNISCQNVQGNQIQVLFIFLCIFLKAIYF